MIGTRLALRRTLTTVAIVWIGAVCIEGGTPQGRSGRPGSRAVSAFANVPADKPAVKKADTTTVSPARELVDKYCVTCHNERLKTANILLDRADAARVSNSSDTWE